MKLKHIPSVLRSYKSTVQSNFSAPFLQKENWCLASLMSWGGMSFLKSKRLVYYGWVGRVQGMWRTGTTSAPPGDWKGNCDVP